MSVTDSSGALLGLNKYDEYGIPGTGNIGRFQYTGQAWLPELGIYYYKNRIYSPTLGRFLQTDPIGPAGGINIYAYVGNDPINWTDPLGLLTDVGITKLVYGQAPQSDENPEIVVTGKREHDFGLGSGLFDRIGLKAGGLLGDLLGAAFGRGRNNANLKKSCPAVPSPGLGKAELDKRVNATATAARFDPIGASRRGVLLGMSVPHGYNDTKSQVRGAHRYGNFLFGASAAATGISLDEALAWGRGAQVVQDASKGITPSGQDNPGDARDIADGYKYYKNGCSGK